MERTLTATATGLWIAPLLALGTAMLYYRISPPTGGSDHDIAASMMSVLLSSLAFVASFVGAVYLVRTYVRPQQLRYLQVIAAVAIFGLLAWARAGWRSTAQHDAPKYAGYEAKLRVEVRARKDLLEGESMDNRFVVFFGNGEAREKKFPELAREDGEYSIMPAELEVSRLHDWSIALIHTKKGGYVSRYWFQLDLPDVPEGNVPWSDWIKPVPHQGSELIEGVTIRYSWVLTPAR